jgi:tetrapyrrole methylase family protein / MazG family protein
MFYRLRSAPVGNPLYNHRYGNVMSDVYTDFVSIVRRLRRECPWDREQTHESIRQNLIEEAYEVIDAIDSKDAEELKQELGDLFLHIVFHSVIAEEANTFTLDDVIRTISEKLIRRHPHVFGDTVVNGQEEVKRNWERIKMNEGRESILDGIPSALPALVRSIRLQEKTSKVGFDWDKQEDCWHKVTEELEELHRATRKEDANEEMESEFGDLLFSLVNYARFLKINPEDALRRTNEKFSRRFRTIEKVLKEQGKDIQNVSLEEMDRIWDSVKRNDETAGSV